MTANGMSAGPVVSITGDAVRLITLNRPANRNALNEALHEGILRAVTDAANDASVRAVVLTGAGSSFCAGGDLSLIEGMRDDPAVRRATFATARSLFQTMMDIEVPVIAAVNGPAIGGGCSLAIMADFIVMAKDAYLADPRAAYGLVAGDGGAVLWPLLVGLPAARRFLLAGDRMSADEALTLGLLYKITAANDVLGEAIALATRLSALPATSLRATKKSLNMHASIAAASVFEFALAAEERGIDDFELPDVPKVARTSGGEHVR